MPTLLLRNLLGATLLVVALSACPGPEQTECTTAADCNDDDACTTDTCDANACKHEAVAVDDGNACTADACSPSTGVSHTPIGVDDGNACTVDSCDPATGVVHSDVEVDDGNPCTVDACEPNVGVTHTDVEVDDGNACTVDACDATNGVTHTAIEVDDGDSCTVDACDPTTGVSHTAVNVDDGNACTTDACDPATGVSHTAVDPDDSNACTTDSCDPATGVANVVISVDDGNACTTDACDPATGVSHTAVVVDDNNVCTTDSCDPASGVAHVAVNVDDGNACTTDTCDPVTGPAHTPVVVDDNNQCTTDTCDPATGVSHTLITADDGVACTLDTCDPQNGIQHTADNSLCETDGYSCTVPTCDVVTGCSETVSAAACNDGAACTTDACIGVGGAAGTGCQNTADNLQCASYEACVVGQGCVAAGTNQSGSVLVTEFQALGSEFIELFNPSTMAVDVHGFVFANLAGQTADIRSLNDLSGMSNAPVSIPAGGYVYGIANPAVGATIPAGVGFVYGVQGTTFALADTGDALSLHLPLGAGIVDLVDFRTFVTDPNAVQTASSFPGIAGTSTQVDPGSLTAAGNDDGGNWCTSFYPASGAKVRVADSRGAANGSCLVAVINEALVDPISTDDTKAFVEIAGPGGMLIGGAKITDVEGLGTSAGVYNAAEVILPAGLRIPVDGLLIVADADSTGVTTVPNVAASDVLVGDMDLENSGGDAVQLISAGGALLDALGTHATGLALAVNVATPNGLAMYETATALFGTSGAALARAASSADTDNNLSDFHLDPTPTPGVPNDTVNVTITSVTPNNTVAGTNTTSGVVIIGTDFASGAQVVFGAAAPVNCSISGSTQLTCTAPANATPGAVDVIVNNPANYNANSAPLANGFTYTASINETDTPAEADFCNIQYPATVTVTSGQSTGNIYGRLYEAGLTDATVGSAAPGVIAALGFGPVGTNPTVSTAWSFTAMTFNTESGNDDEYQGAFTVPTVTAATTYNYVVRFSFDNGVNWTYCDTSGAGSNAGQDFAAADLGVLTVNP